MKISELMTALATLAGHHAGGIADLEVKGEWDSFLWNVASVRVVRPGDEHDMGVKVPTVVLDVSSEGQP